MMRDSCTPAELRDFLARDALRVSQAQKAHGEVVERVAKLVTPTVERLGCAQAWRGHCLNGVWQGFPMFRATKNCDKDTHQHEVELSQKEQKSRKSRRITNDFF